MTSRLIVAGISHRTAPLELRERIALPPGDQPRALGRLVPGGGLSEALVLSTCHRTEIYGRAQGEEGGAADVLAVAGTLEELRPGVAEAFSAHGYRHVGEAALAHLFRVVSGLDSVVLGEHEIAGQVSRAYALACSAGTAGPYLHRAVPRAIQVGRRVRAETRLGRGTASVAGAAVALVERVFRDVTSCRVLGVGAGDTVATALRVLRGRGVTEFEIANRTPERARLLAAELDGDVAGLEGLGARVARADVVVAATDAREPLVRLGDVGPHLRERGSRPLVVLDLGVPRDVDPLLGSRPGVYVYTVDDLEGIANAGRERRRDDVPRAEAIVHGAVAQFRLRRRELEAAPAIRALLDGLLHERGAALHREHGLGEEARAVAERVTGRMIDRIVRRLAPGIKSGELPTAALLDALGAHPGAGDARDDEDPPAARDVSS